MGSERKTTYADAGVDRGAAARAVEIIGERVRSTFRPEVVGDLGHFAGLFALDTRRYRDPLLVMATDGVGTKVMIAQMMGVHDTVGIDLVAMSANDVSAMGAEPVSFLDYIVCGRVDSSVIDHIVKGVAEGCRQAGCALVGGEIAEHPGHLQPDSYDLAGFCVGLAERGKLVDGSKIQPGDVVLGIESSGLHSNGFSLVRKVLLDDMGLRLDDRPLNGEATLGEVLLRPSLIYAPVVERLTSEVEVHGLAHITQGGIEENLGRILPEATGATIEKSSWEPPAIFGLVSSLGRVPDEEMFATFNMGIGMAAVVETSAVNGALDIIRGLGHRAHEIGFISEAKGADLPVIVR